ncbi:TPA: energy-coupling factor transporter transmembrane protein EcfT [bacterium]|nr:energy-coupling factor transporter transmembrane protein EcfT [bacterium]
MKNLSLGRYIPNDTFIHRLDPRTKILAMIFLLVIVFMEIGFLGYFILGIFLLILLKVTKVSFRTLFRLIKNMWFMFLFLFIINILSFQRGNVLLDLEFFKIYDSGIYQTLYIIIRLVIMITITTILTTSTKPLDMTYGLEYLMTPLKIIKFPTHEIAMIISIALRFIPTLLDETERIMKAQASRGSILSEGKLKDKIPAIISLIIPLFFSAFKRSDELADAMEARGYDPSAKRTRYRVLKFTSSDWLSLSLIVVITAGFVYLSFNKEMIESLLGIDLWR